MMKAVFWLQLQLSHDNECCNWDVPKKARPRQQMSVALLQALVIAQ
ncbi:MAG TPA: hypothetical protein V6D09_05080 [Leptolyngbyaceae cyanobacterium]